MSPGKMNKRWVMAATAVCAAALAGSAWTWWRSPGKTAAAASVSASAPMTAAVSAMGRFEPMEPVTHVSAPYVDGHPATVAEVRVAEGDHVRAGQVIAVLAERQQLGAALEEARARVAAEHVKLQEAQESPRASDVAARAAEVERWQAAARTAESDYERYHALRETHDVSASDLEAKRSQMVNAQQMLQAAKAAQTALSERHAENVQSAQAQLEMAKAQLERATLDHANAEVRAPVDGVILHVRARPGEQVGAAGIVELARTSQMDVLAEVYESDISRVHSGEHADVTSALLPGGTKLSGTVVDIGREVGGTTLSHGDSAAFADARVVLVRIRLADGAVAANLIDGKVSVVLQP